MRKMLIVIIINNSNIKMDTPFSNIQYRHKDTEVPKSQQAVGKPVKILIIPLLNMGLVSPWLCVFLQVFKG